MPPTDYKINNYNHVIFTSDVAWDPSILENKTDLGILNNNLNLHHGEGNFGARLSDTGEKGTLDFGARLLDNGENGTQRIIAKMLTKHCYSNIQWSVLSR